MDESLGLHVLLAVEQIPRRHKVLLSESPEAKESRRKILANKIRVLADDLEKDKEAKHLYIDRPPAISNCPIKYPHTPPLPTFPEYMKEMADFIENRKTPDDPFEEGLKGKKTTRIKLKDFAKKEVLWLLDKLLGYPKRAPREEARLLSNALLDPSDQVTVGQMKQVKRHPHAYKQAPRRNTSDPLQDILSNPWG